MRVVLCLALAVYSVLLSSVGGVGEFLNLTETTTGCVCDYDPSSSACACCLTDGVTNACQCPHLTTPSMCTMCDLLHTCPTDYDCSILTSDGCFELGEGALSYEAARQKCEGPDSFLAEIDTQETFSQVLEGLSEPGQMGVWTGLRVKDHLWRWVLKNTTRATTLQGCYKKQGMGTVLKDVDNLYVSVDLTPFGCLQHCQNYTYAGLSMKDSQTDPPTTGIVCQCSDQFDPRPLVKSDRCNEPCVNYPDQMCGGLREEIVMVTNGAYRQEFRSQSNDAHCAGLDLNAKEGEQWITVACSNTSMGHVCDHPGLNESECIDNLQYVDGRCLSIHTYGWTWHRAHGHCVNNSAHLVFISDGKFEEALRDLLTQTQALWWIGLTDRALVWTDDRPLTYLPEALRPAMPDFSQGDCVAVLEYIQTTSLVDCSQNYSFYCQREKNECASDPCQNGAACVDLINGFDCDCNNMWTGKLCDQPKSSPNTQKTTNPTTSPITTGSPDTTDSPAASSTGKGGDGGNSGGQDGKEGDGGGDGDLDPGVVAAIVIGVVIVIVAVAMVIGVVMWRSNNKMVKELEELKKNVDLNGLGASNGGFGLNTQDELYETLPDSQYDHLSPDNQYNHSYSAIKTGSQYQGLEGREDSSAGRDPLGTTYQSLDPGTTYQGLVDDKPAANGTGPGYQALGNTGSGYQALGNTEAQYEGLQKDSQTTPTPQYEKLTDDRPTLPPARGEDYLAPQPSDQPNIYLDMLPPNESQYDETSRL